MKSSRPHLGVLRVSRWYSWGSRMASELGGITEKIWGALTLSGDENSLRLVSTAVLLRRPFSLKTRVV